MFLAFIVNANGFRLQGVGVQGRLLCGDKALRNTKVKIYDVDRNPGDSDDLLDEGYTDANGEFRLDGTTRELTDIEPILKIFHDCNDGIRPCQKRVIFDVPKKYIHHGTVNEWFDVGELNMEMTFRNEERDCNV
ncbi:Transthyretin-like protein 46 [Toxocara canis]|uniref:Transthyretin-like protein 46 n=1 Tax=Toxocara canis TaxID=6265 RepID=A0A0B2W0V2_TOXCA|nr:Transthyretin-like protein 46 [Toxocara canis]